MMQIFNAIVRLQGQTHHEVYRRGLTVPEIYIIRRIHGNDAVVKLEHAGYADIDPLDERERLDYEYSAGLGNLHEDQKTSVEKMFGADFAPLPEELRDFEGPLVDVKKPLLEFQESVPYASPNSEDKGAQIRKKAAAKVVGKKDAAMNAPKAAQVKVPTVKEINRAALDAVL